jgi:hypothetical protein
MGARRGRQGRARYLFREKDTDEDGNLTEAVIWRVPVSTSYPEGVRYRLAFIGQRNTRPLSFTTTITRRVTIATFAERRGLTDFAA